MLIDSSILRRGVEADLPQVLGLIQELAAYERAPEAVTNTLAAMQRDGFGPAPIFSFFVLEDEASKIIGLARYYTAYSTYTLIFAHLHRDFFSFFVCE